MRWMSREELDAIEAVERDASPGPWWKPVNEGPPDWPKYKVEGPEYYDDIGNDHNHIASGIQARRNADFIVAARVAVPQLLAEVHKLRRYLHDTYGDDLE